MRELQWDAEEGVCKASRSSLEMHIRLHRCQSSGYGIPAGLANSADASLQAQPVGREHRSGGLVQGCQQS